MTLTHVLALDIILLQRTTKIFLGAVESSPALQRELFFHPDACCQDSNYIEVNPFQRKLCMMEGPMRSSPFDNSKIILRDTLMFDIKQLQNPTAS